MSDYLDLDDGLSERLNEGVKVGSGREIPIAGTPFIRVDNGDIRQKKYANDDPVSYFGGWAVGKADFDSLAERISKPIPAGWYETTRVGDEGEYSVYVARTIFVALIGKRESWFNVSTGPNGQKVTRRYPDFPKHLKARGLKFNRKTHFLGVLASRTDAGFEAYHPVVLTATNYQAGHIGDAFGEWVKITSTTRSRLTPPGKKPYPAWAFYTPLGTWGKEPEIEKAGSGKDTSPITPIRTYQNRDAVTEDKLRGLFVGNESARQMVEYLDLCQEWLHAWDEVYDEGQLDGVARPDPRDPEMPREYHGRDARTGASTAVPADPTEGMPEDEYFDVPSEEDDF